MSSEFNEQSCVRCKSYLFADDDVVVCPICGAPHHRECYEALGHCALEELHGTEREYSKIKEKVKEESKPVKVTEQPRPNDDSFPPFANMPQFDLLGGVPADYDLGEGVTADEAKRFVMANTHRYIPKFAILNKKNKISWNWMAFVCPTGWLLSRKMYKLGIASGVFSVIGNILMLPLSGQLYGVDATVDLALQSTMANLSEVGKSVVILAVIGTLVQLAVSLTFALLGDWLYKGYTLDSIKAINTQSEDRDVAFRKKGGVSFLLFMLGFMLVNYVSNIIGIML